MSLISCASSSSCTNTKLPGTETPFLTAAIRGPLPTILGGTDHSFGTNPHGKVFLISSSCLCLEALESCVLSLLTTTRGRLGDRWSSSFLLLP